MGTVLITGANRGIGLELCKQLRARGEDIIAVCRQPSEGLEALGVRIEQGVDLTIPDTIEALAARLEGAAIDLLINNAGVLTFEDLSDLDFARIHRQFEINALGPLRVTHALLGHLAPAARVAIITSRMGSIGDNTSGRYYGYRMSKAAVNMAGVSLAHDLRPRDVAVGIFHPGMVATDMTNNYGIPAADAASMLLQRIDALSLDTSGSFFHANGEQLPW